MQEASVQANLSLSITCEKRRVSFRKLSFSLQMRKSKKACCTRRILQATSGYSICDHQLPISSRSQRPTIPIESIFRRQPRPPHLPLLFWTPVSEDENLRLTKIFEQYIELRVAEGELEPLKFGESFNDLLIISDAEDNVSNEM